MRSKGGNSFFMKGRKGTSFCCCRTFSSKIYDFTRGRLQNVSVFFCYKSLLLSRNNFRSDKINCILGQMHGRGKSRFLPTSLGYSPEFM